MGEHNSDDDLFVSSSPKRRSSTQSSELRGLLRKRLRKLEDDRVMSSPNPQDAKEFSQPSQYVFRLAIDYGTTKIAAAWQIYHVDPDLCREPNDVRFGSHGTRAPNIAAYDNGSFIWGMEVSEKLEAHNLSETKIIRFAKLAIFPDPKTQVFKESVIKKLGMAGKTINDLVEDGLRCIIAHAKEDAMATLQGLQHDIDSMPLQLFLSVPQMWNPPANRVMAEAARKAGAPHCELVYEPECAAVHAIIEQMQHMAVSAPFLKVGDTILMADIGGGTADFVSYKIESDLADRASIKLTTAQRPSGSLCGGQFVNEEFLRWFEHERQTPQEFAAILARLGYSNNKADFLAIASAEFEKVKVTFNNNSNSAYNIFIFGNHGYDGDFEHVKCDIHTVRSWFDRVIHQIEDVMTELLRRCNVKVILLPGGFGHCPYLIQRLRTSCGQQMKVLEPPSSAYPNPVPRGALLRHKATVRSVGSGFSWGTFIEEEWDPIKHPDANLKPDGSNNTKRVLSKAKLQQAQILPDPHVVFQDSIHPDIDQVVKDRWNPLLTKGTEMISQSQTERQYKLFYFEVPEDGGPVTENIDIYWSPEVIEQHSPGRKIFLNQEAREAAGPTDNLQNNIFHWATVPICVDNDPKELGWRTEIDKHGNFVYEVHVCYALKFNGPNIEFIYDLRQRDSQPYDEMGNPREVGDEEFNWEPQWKCAIWNESHNPFPREV